jgi:methylthioribose-1-phosphate isomerase
MRIEGISHAALEVTEAGVVRVLDQTLLPHQVVWRELAAARDAENAIREMWVRGAPLIGVTAAFGVALAMRVDASDASLQAVCSRLLATRPTAVNLAWALGQMTQALRTLSEPSRAVAALTLAKGLAAADVAVNHAIGAAGLPVLKAIHDRKGRVDILTHCNAGWLATVDRGTATAPIYAARDAGLQVHVWVDETRPRNQGASLTAWELGQEGIAHTLIVDNAGGLLMQQGKVDLVIVGADRVTAGGDVCNKIGTYLKALAARDNGLPFYVAAPRSSIDREIQDALCIPIEERSPREVTHVQGLDADGILRQVQVTPHGTRVHNPGFDLTPARLITALITEHGLIPATSKHIEDIFKEAHNYA